MRIVGGKLKGRRLQPPSNLNARPTTDFAKEALFNILSNRIELSSIQVLDLFAGSGGIAFEFISRGAEDVKCVDINYHHVRAIKSQAKAWQLTNLFAIKLDVFKFLKTNINTFDLVFADPPYDLKNLSEIPDIVLNGTTLAKDGLLVLEHGKDHNFSSHPNFDVMKTYSSVNFSFFQHLTQQ